MKILQNIVFLIVIIIQMLASLFGLFLLGLLFYIVITKIFPLIGF